MTSTYVIGHVNPDTDTIASAVGYAWLLQERDGDDVQPARAGALNPQTTWVLKRLGVEPPTLLTDASPRFSSVTRRFDTTTPARPLQEAWAIASRTGGVAPVVNEDGTPYGLIHGWSLFSFFSETIGPHPSKQEQPIAEILNSPCREACDTNVPRFKEGDRIRDALHRILRVEDNDFWVVDEEGLYVGVCRQRDLLNPPRLRLILVDHNEPRQAIGSLEEAELVEILDHHRLDNPSTHIPIRFTVDVVGSTSTLVAERISEAGLSAPPAIAGLLLAGLVSDTLILTSPTTTERDHQTAERLGRWAFGKNAPLGGETLQSFGEQVVRAGTGLTSRDADEIVSTDIKIYEAGGLKFLIAQAEVTDLLQLDEIREALFEALNRLREKRGLNFSMLMVTDVVRGSSRLLLSEGAETLNELPYPRLADGTREAQGVVSRKKQLLPVVLGLLEDERMSMYHEIAEMESRGEAGVLCTVVRCSGSTPRREGSKMLVYPDGSTKDTIGGGEMESRVVDEALTALKDGKPRLIEYSFVDPERGDVGVCGGQMEVYVEPITSPFTVVLVGGGHVGRAVAHLAHWLGFRVVVSDDREEFCTPESVPGADMYLPGPIAELPKSLKITPQTYVVLTTRGVDIDVEGLPALLDTPAAYIGVIGSRRRWTTTRERLAETGIPEEKLDRVVSPMGLNIYSETPEEIAVSILAEIILRRHDGVKKQTKAK